MKKMLLLLSPLLVMLLLFAKCEDDDEQTVELPAPVKNYLDTHYAGYEIEASETDTLCTGTAVYEVELEGPGDKELDLTFDTEGNLLFSETEIKTSQLPAAVSAGISAKYAGYALKEAEQLNLAGGGVQYEVELKKGETTLEVLFTADGSFVCETTEPDDDDE